VRVRCVGGQNTVHDYCVHLSVLLVLSFVDAQTLVVYSSNKLCFLYDVYNYPDATTFSFINLFNSALHVSGDKFEHPQENFFTVYTAFCTIHRHFCQLVASSVDEF
jgi:hypothetical protein